jgi:hypothetical protein
LYFCGYSLMVTLDAHGGVPAQASRRIYWYKLASSSSSSSVIDPTLPCQSRTILEANIIREKWLHKTLRRWRRSKPNIYIYKLFYYFVE